MNLLITKEIEGEEVVHNDKSSQPKSSLNQMIDNVHDIEYIIRKLAENKSPMMKLVGVILRGYTSNMDSLIRADIYAYEDQMFSLYDSLSKFSSVQSDTLYKKYEKYLPADGEFRFLNHIMTDKLTKYDISSVLSLMYSGLFDTIRALQDATENTLTEAKKNEKTNNMMEYVMSKDHGHNPSGEFIKYSDSEKFYYKILEKARVNDHMYRCIVNNRCKSYDFSKNHRLPHLSYIINEFCDFIQMTISGPIYNFIWSPIYQLTKYLSFFLTMQLKSLFGDNIFIDYLAKTKIPVESIDCDENTKLCLVSLIVFYAYAVEMYEQELSFYGSTPETEQQLITLNTVKELSLELIQKAFTDKPSDVKKFVNHIYEIFCNDEIIGKCVPEKFRLGNGPFIRFASFIRDDTECMSSEAIDKVIERIKDVRNKDVYGEYREDIATFLYNSYSIDAFEKISKWITRVEKYNDQKDPMMNLEYMRYKNMYGLHDIWKQMWEDPKSKITMLGDTSDFAAWLSIAPNNLFRSSNIRKSILNDAKSLILSIIVNAHMNDERSLNWKPNTIKLLNLYIGYIASVMSECIYRNNYANDICLFNPLMDLFNVCGKLNYRTYRIPQFRFKKDDIPPIEHMQPYTINTNWLNTVIANATENLIHKTPESTVESVVHYLGDGILNNAVNAEFVIMILTSLDRKYPGNSPFTKLTRYIITHVGSPEDDFYKSFENKEILDDNLKVFDDNEVLEGEDFKNRVTHLEKYLEIYVFIGILQRILINFEFNKIVENTYRDTTIDFTNVELKAGRNRMVSKLGTQYVETQEDGLVALEENPFVKDITNAMHIFDLSFVGANTKSKDWFEQNKDKIIVNNQQTIDQLRDKPSYDDQGPVTVF